ncbi:WG repeat-containing protein, partial [Pseudobacteroides sp.]|uniref:WG repeat-containing protein n=1 Tax=Pseudobacteroides sp. TaxID=1968840 RepID=UPI0039C95E2E
MENAYFVMKIGSLYGYINADGKFLIEPQYKRADDFSDEVAFVKTTDDKYG